jgi:hypothetical protein
MRHCITTLILTTLINLLFGQEAVVYHSYHETASSWDIDDWNVPDTTNNRWLLKETSDSLGRVVLLEFLDNGQPAGHLCYLANRVTFEYKDDRIIETLYSGDEELLATDCEMPYRTVYYLDSVGYILKAENFAKYDLTGLRPSEIDQWKTWVPEYKLRTIEEEKSLQVDYYYYSYFKMAGIYPVPRSFKHIDNYRDNNQPENNAIIEGIKKLTTTPAIK